MCRVLHIRTERAETDLDAARAENQRLAGQFAQPRPRSSLPEN
jgi:hypothetical protein